MVVNVNACEARNVRETIKSEIVVTTTPLVKNEPTEQSNLTSKDDNVQLLTIKTEEAATSDDTLQNNICSLIDDLVEPTQHDDLPSKMIKPEPNLALKTDPKPKQSTTPSQHIQDLRLPHVIFSNTVCISESILKYNQSLDTTKKVSFNPRGCFTPIPIKSPLKLILSEPSNCKRKSSVDKNSLKLNTTARRETPQKHVDVNADLYLVDSIETPDPVRDPPLLKTNINRSQPKIVTQTNDTIVSTFKPLQTNLNESDLNLPPFSYFPVKFPDSPSLQAITNDDEVNHLLNEIEETILFLPDDDYSDAPSFEKEPFHFVPLDDLTQVDEESQSFDDDVFVDTNISKDSLKPLDDSEEIFPLNKSNEDLFHKSDSKSGLFYGRLSTLSYNGPYWTTPSYSGLQTPSEDEPPFKKKKLDISKDWSFDVSNEDVNNSLRSFSSVNEIFSSPPKSTSTPLQKESLNLSVTPPSQPSPSKKSTSSSINTSTTESTETEVLPPSVIDISSDSQSSPTSPSKLKVDASKFLKVSFSEISLTGVTKITKSNQILNSNSTKQHYDPKSKSIIFKSSCSNSELESQNSVNPEQNLNLSLGNTAEHSRQTQSKSLPVSTCPPRKDNTGASRSNAGSEQLETETIHSSGDTAGSSNNTKNQVNPQSNLNLTKQNNSQQSFPKKLNKIKYSDLFSSNPPTMRPASRSNHNVVSREFVENDDEVEPEPPDRINKLLGVDFYSKYHWVYKKNKSVPQE